MLKKLSLLAFCIFAAVSYAVQPGDRPGETPFPLKWIDCSPMPLGIVKADIHKNIPDLRAVVFMLTRANDTPNTIAMLETLRIQYSGKLLISVITPDNVDDAEALRKRFPDMRLRVAVDMERRLTPEYMRGTVMLFPMAFLMDKNGVVLWRGEAVDLPEALEKFLAGKLFTVREKELYPKIYQMQQSMRDGNLFNAFKQAQDILADNPDHPQALRMAVFAAENLRKLPLAWQCVAHAIDRSPGTARLYFTALDLIIRHRDFREKLPDLIRNFSKQPFLPGIRFAFAEALLNSFTYEINAVAGAKDILAGTPMPLAPRGQMMADLLAVRADLNYALGDVPAAERDLAEAVKCFDDGGSRAKLERIEKRLKFFRALLKLKGASRQ